MLNRYERLKAQVGRLKRQNELLHEKLRIAQEENAYLAEALGRMRLHGQVDLALLHRELRRLGKPPAKGEK
jgi:hypothetical protein